MGLKPTNSTKKLTECLKFSKQVNFLGVPHVET